MASTLPDIPRADLAILVRAVRRHAPSARSHKDLRAAAAIFLAILIASLHSAESSAWTSSQAHVGAYEENPMLSPRQIAVVSSLALSSAAVAQDAVQWRVEDGGNGHWYAIIPSGLSFDDAAAAATQLGAHLVTIQSAEEQSFVATQIASGTPFLNAWMGLRQDPKSTEPAGGWRWVTGEPLSGYTNWWLGVPQPDNNACSAGIPENFAMWAKQWGGAWADVTSDAVPGAPCSGPQTHALLEWSADCNADGIVDYGQIRSGELADTNANNIPDCCEQGIDCRFKAVQWQSPVGGNGHWYEGVTSLIGITWPQASASAQAVGGHLVSLHSAGEQSFVWTIAGTTRMWAAGVGPWLGGYQPAGSQEPAGGWRWSSGEPWDWSDWQGTEPGNSCASEPEDALMYFPLVGTTPAMRWNDYPSEVPCAGYPLPRSYVVEWSADCNNDGIVDYGQIRVGELADANANNIPDCCEGGASCNPCPGDVDGSGAVNGVDLAAVLNNWGTSGGKYPGADTNHDGIVDGADLAEVLGGWGPCR